MEFVSKIFELINGDLILKVGFGHAQWFGGAVSGFLLIIAVLIKGVQLNAEGLYGKPNFSKFISDTFTYAAFLSAYGICLNYYAEGINVLYATVDKNVSVETINNSMEKLVNTILSQNVDVEEAPSLLKNPGAWVPYLIYMVTAVITMAVSLFLRLAESLALVTAYWWGLIVIPMAIVSQFNKLKGWAIFLTSAMLWPVIEAFFLWLFSETFYEAANATLTFSDSYLSQQLALISAYMLFAVLNMIVLAIVVAAPFVTNALVSNSGSISGIVAPFAGAAITSGAALGKYAANKGKQSGKLLASGVGRGLKSDHVHASVGKLGGAIGSQLATDYGEFKSNQIVEKKLAKNREKTNRPFNKFLDQKYSSKETGINDSSEKSNSTSNTKDSSTEKPQQKSTTDPHKAVMKAAAASSLINSNQGSESENHNSNTETQQNNRKNLTKRQEQARRGAIINRNRKNSQGKRTNK